MNMKEVYINIMFCQIDYVLTIYYINFHIYQCDVFSFHVQQLDIQGLHLSDQHKNLDASVQEINSLINVQSLEYCHIFLKQFSCFVFILYPNLSISSGLYDQRNQ